MTDDPGEDTSSSRSPLGRRLAGVPIGRRETIVLEMVRAQVAIVLGHDSPEAVRESASIQGARGRLARRGGDSQPPESASHGCACRPRSCSTTPRPTRLPPTCCASSPVDSRRLSSLRSPVALRSTSRSRSSGWAAAIRAGSPRPTDLWELVASGADAIGEFPSDRGWDVERLYDPDPDRTGTSYCRHGGFLYDAARVRRRVLRDQSRGSRWRWIRSSARCSKSPGRRSKHAGIDPAALRGSQTGVFAGVMVHDYGVGLTGSTSEGLEGYGLTGSAGSVVSGRVAYALRVGGAGGDGRYGVLLVAGGAASGLPVVACR